MTHLLSPIHLLQFAHNSEGIETREVAPKVKEHAFVQTSVIKVYYQQIKKL